MAALLLAGVALLGVIVYQTDLAELWNYLRRIGVWGVAAILGLFCLASVLETVSWQLKLLSIRLDIIWMYRLWKLRLVGEAFNIVTPLASLGGEPLKAALINSHYGIGYREAAASLILEQTVQNLALIPFLLIGFVLLLGAGVLPLPYQVAAGVGLMVFSTSIVLFFLVQRYKFFSRLGRGFGTRASAVLGLVHDLEDRLIVFYTCYGRRFALALALEFVSWMLSAVEIGLILRLLGYSAGFGEAWTIAAGVVLVRSGLFLVPAGIGVQEGAALLIGGALTGSPALGLAVSLVLRFREIIWVALGLVLGGLFTFESPRPGSSEPAAEAHGVKKALGSRDANG